MTRTADSASYEAEVAMPGSATVETMLRSLIVQLRRPGRSQVAGVSIDTGAISLLN